MARKLIAVAAALALVFGVSGVAAAGSLGEPMTDTPAVHEFEVTDAPEDRVYNFDLGEWYEDIQEAIDEAGDGNTIYVTPGTYNESVVINIKDLKLYGAVLDGDATHQPSWKVRDAKVDGDVIIDADGGDYSFEVDRSAPDLGLITVEGFKCVNWVKVGIAQSMHENAPKATFRVINNIVLSTEPADAHGNGIQVSGDGSLVQGNKVDGAVHGTPDYSAGGILVIGASNVEVLGNTVINSDDGIQIAGAGTWTVPIASNNVVSGNDISGNNRSGIYLYEGVTGTSITGNTIANNPVGIETAAHPDHQPTNTTVTGNVFACNTRHVDDSDTEELNLLAILKYNTFTDNKAVRTAVHTIEDVAVLKDIASVSWDETPPLTVEQYQTFEVTFDACLNTGVTMKSGELADITAVDGVLWVIEFTDGYGNPVLEENDVTMVVQVPPATGFEVRYHDTGIWYYSGPGDKAGYAWHVEPVSIATFDVTINVAGAYTVTIQPVRADKQ